MEQVVLLSSDGSPIGTALKRDVHTEDTPLHLAFSCYVIRQDGAILVTRRALTKRAWPGVWSNSFCGHPAPEESFEDAMHRRAETELGMRITTPESVLPDFRYRAVDASGVVENEVCPVYIARALSFERPNPEEVSETDWVQPSDLAIAVTHAPFAFSPWLALQLPQLIQQVPHLRRVEQ